MDPAAAREIAGWCYPAPYDAYDMGLESTDWLLDPANGYHAARDEAGDVVGFCCVGHDARVPGGDYDGEALDVGLGLRPDLTGRGLGAAFLGAVLAHARSLHAPRGFRLTVADWNERALAVYGRAGFRRNGEFTRAGGGTRFVLLERPT